MRKSIDEKNIADIYQSMMCEDIDTGSVFGDVEGHGGDLENEDFYATGDTRYPYLLGIQTRAGNIKRKKDKKRKKS